MRDREVVASIVAGDPAGLAEAYDKYARVLYSYSKTFLREPADAADVVHDTFVIAAGNLDRLRDPERLRPWLYAVARNLCLRKLRAEKAVAAEWADIDFAPDDSEDSDIGGEAERAELRALLRAAGGGLNAGERDIVELRLWQGLDTAEAAAVLGITRAHAHLLMSRGRDQLTASVAALLVARTGREECATLDRLLSGWDGQLTVLLRKRLSRHIEHCDSCSDRRRRELQPALLSLWPAGVLAAEALGSHAMHAAAVPAGLKARVLAATSGKDATTAAKAVRLTGGGRGVRGNGFPKPAAAHRTGPAHGTHAHLALWTAAGTVAAAVVAAAVVAGTHGGPGGRPGSALGLGGTVTSSGPGPGGPGGAAPPGSLGAQPGAGSSGTGGPGSVPGAGGGQSGSPGSGGRGVVPVVTLKPAAQPSAGSSAPPAGGAPSSSPGGAPSSSSPAAPPASSSPPSSSSPAAPPASSPPSSSSPPVQPPAQGTLTVSPGTVVLTPLLGSTITLTAEGGPVSWSISEPASLLGELIVSPSSGTLAAGQSATVSISVSGLASLDTTLTVNPGGHPVTVVLGVGL
jgi:RNA polymerase sigma factor (sigma-70 family)